MLIIYAKSCICRCIKKTNKKKKKKHNSLATCLLRSYFSFLQSSLLIKGLLLGTVSLSFRQLMIADNSLIYSFGERLLRRWYSNNCNCFCGLEISLCGPGVEGSLQRKWCCDQVLEFRVKVVLVSRTENIFLCYLFKNCASWRLERTLWEIVSCYSILERKKPKWMVPITSWTEVDPSRLEDLALAVRPAFWLQTGWSSNLQWVFCIVLWRRVIYECYMKTKTLSLVMSLIIIWVKQWEQPCSCNTNPKYSNYLHTVPPHQHWWEQCSQIKGTTSAEVGFLPVDACEQFVLKFCQKMTSVLPLKSMETSQCSFRNDSMN